MIFSSATLFFHILFRNVHLKRLSTHVKFKNVQILGKRSCFILNSVFAAYDIFYIFIFKMC